MFQSASEGRQQISPDDVVRQVVPECGERRPTRLDCRQLNWWHNKTDGAMQRSSTR